MADGQGLAGPRTRSRVPTVTDARWQRVKTLFQGAVERPEAERAAFLKAAAGGDEDVIREVQSLLDSDAAGHSILERFPLADAAAAASSPRPIHDETHLHPTLKAGDRVGTYELVGLIGAGAMGQVYRARDTRLNRDVALKMLPEAFGLDAD